MAFISAALIHMGAGYTPRCGCMGGLQKYLSWRDDTAHLVVRNTVLASVLGTGMLCRAAAFGRRRRRGGTRDSAFTVVELLFVIAIIGLLSVLLAPSLASTRERARAVASLANLRSHATIFGAYAFDFRDAAPHFLSVTAPMSTVVNPANGYTATVPYFGAHFTWNIALASGYYGGDNFLDCFRSPSVGGPTDGQTDYAYSCTFVAAPGFWNPATRAGPTQWAGTRVTDAVYASKKVLLWDSWQHGAASSVALRATERVALLDGSALDARGTRFIGRSMVGGDGPWLGAMHGTGYPPGLHTWDGVRGHDLND